MLCHTTTRSAAPQETLSQQHSSHSGFSLLELLLSMAITVIAVVAAVGLMTKFTRAAAAFTEASTMEEARGTAETLLRADLDGAGRNLTRPTPPLAGTIYGAPTASDSYTWSDGTITKTAATGWDNPAQLTHALSTGLGTFSFTPSSQGATAYISSPNGDSAALVIGFGNPDEGVSTALYVNGSEVAASTGHSPSETLPEHISGDSYAFKIENGTSQRVAKLYKTQNDVPSLLWTSNTPVSSYPISFAINVYNQGQSFTNVRLTGAPLIALSGNDTEIASLPNDLDTQLTSPITTTVGGAGVTILSGDKTTDSVRTTFVFDQNSTEIIAATPTRGSFNTGDYVLLIDWESDRFQRAGRGAVLNPASPSRATSALCRVSSTISTADTTTLSIERVRADNPAWARLWSSDTDHEHSFPPGSTLTKLQPPVSYTRSSDSRLVRMEADRASTIAFNVRHATFNRYIEFNSTAQIFQVDITFAAEGVETNSTLSDETRGTIEFRSSPRALNLASNQLN